MASNAQSAEEVRPPQMAPSRPEGRIPAVSRLFPLGYKEGFNQWWASIPAATAEHRVLSFVPYLQQPPTHLQTGKVGQIPNESADSMESADHSQASEVSAKSVNDPHGPRVWRSTMVELSGKDRSLNEFSVERVGEKVENNLIILHGYGAGLGFFYKNFEALSRAKGWQLYALDLLGMGRSTRPPFKIKAKDRQQAIREAEDWFIDALEEWRVKRKIDRFTLLGHSLGGYMAVAYALKYPGRLNKLILASPVGIPEDPFAISAEMPEPSDSALANEFAQNQSDVVQPPSDPTKAAADNNILMNARNANNNNNYNSNGQRARKPLPKWFAYLWDANISPFTFVRWAGPFGPRLVSGWTSRRFSHLPQPEAQALHDYAYSLFRLRGSGEYALAYILAPGAFARSPLIRRIHGVGRQMLSQPEAPQAAPVISDTQGTPSDCAVDTQPSQSLPAHTPTPHRENGLPIVFMYGDRDWMDVSGGHEAKAKLDEERERALKHATPEERAADRGSAKVVVIKNAGHHLYLDGYEEFNSVILKEMKDVSEHFKKVKEAL